MENTNKEIDDLNNALKDIAEEHWTSFEYPILLSNIPPLLQEKVSNYKEVLKGTSLKAFIKESAGKSGYKLHEHPQQKARVGIIPASEHYEYEIQDTTDSSIAIDSKKREEVLISFFKSLATLPKEEIEKVNIPASVIVKLLK